MGLVRYPRLSRQKMFCYAVLAGIFILFISYGLLASGFALLAFFIIMSAFLVAIGLFGMMYVWKHAVRAKIGLTAIIAAMTLLMAIPGIQNTVDAIQGPVTANMTFKSSECTRRFRSGSFCDAQFTYDGTEVQLSYALRQSIGDWAEGDSVRVTFWPHSKILITIEEGGRP